MCAEVGDRAADEVENRHQLRGGGALGDALETVRGTEDASAGDGCDHQHHLVASSVTWPAHPGEDGGDPCGQGPDRERGRAADAGSDGRTHGAGRMAGRPADSAL